MSEHNKINNKEYDDFLKVFGMDIEGDNQISVVVPLWDLLDSGREIPRYSKRKLDGTRIEYHGPNQVVAFGDLKAYIIMASLFMNIYSKPVNYYHDTNKELEKIKDTVITVGSPLANSFTKRIFELYPDEAPFIFVEFEETEEHPNVEAILDTNNGTLYDGKMDWEYGMVLRFPNKYLNENYYFVVSGCSEYSTLASASFLKNNWNKFKNANEISGFLIELKMGKSYPHRIVKSYNFKS
jgi:hypothetical protein